MIYGNGIFCITIFIFTEKLLDHGDMAFAQVCTRQTCFLPCGGQDVRKIIIIPFCQIFYLCHINAFSCNVDINLSLLLKLIYSLTSLTYK